MRWCHGTLAGLFLFAASSLQSCAGTPASPASEEDLTPALSVKELMEHIVDPIADWIFDAAVIDISEKGIVESR